MPPLSASGYTCVHSWAVNFEILVFCVGRGDPLLSDSPTMFGEMTNLGTLLVVGLYSSCHLFYDNVHCVSQEMSCPSGVLAQAILSVGLWGPTCLRRGLLWDNDLF